MGNTLLKAVRPHYELKIFKHTREVNIVDAAVAKPDRPDLIADEIIDIGKIEGIDEAKLGSMVKKSGRTTGVTEGEVTALGVSLKVELEEDEYGWFSDQVVCDALVRPGDSGSLVVNEEQKAVGLVFAGSDQYSIFNRISNVLRSLNVKF